MLDNGAKPNIAHVLPAITLEYVPPCIFPADAPPSNQGISLFDARPSNEGISLSDAPPLNKGILLSEVPPLNEGIFMGIIFPADAPPLNEGISLSDAPPSNEGISLSDEPPLNKGNNDDDGCCGRAAESSRAGSGIVAGDEGGRGGQQLGRRASQMHLIGS
jgi:hypothetical protein